MSVQYETGSNISMLAVTAIWGITFVAIKSLFVEISPGNIILFRILTAGGLLPLVSLLPNGKVSLKDFFYLCLLGGIGVTLFQMLWIYALKYTSVVNVSIILYSAPLFTTLFSTLLGRDSFKTDKLLAVLAGLIGIWIVITHGRPAFTDNTLKGDLLAMAGAAIWSIYVFLSKPLLSRYSPLKVAVYSIVTGSILLCPFIPFLFSGNEFAELSLAGWLALVFTVLFSIIIAFLLWYRGMNRIGPVRAITYQYLVPVFSTLFAVILLKEKLCVPQIAGGLIVCGSIALARKL
jgi:drug/metabolite transporter (DMT)-like permease